MSWYAFAIPAILVALLVRFEAKAIGPYWSWLELIRDEGDEDPDTQKRRRQAFIRRVSIPAVVGFAAVALFPEVYGALDLLVLGVAAAGLLLWPMLFAGPPWGISTSYLVRIYLLFVVAFGGSAWLGGHAARFAHAEGGVVTFLQENAISLLIGVVVTTFSTATLSRVSSAASRKRGEG